MRRDAPAEEPKKVKKVQPKDDAPAKKLKPGVGKVKRGVVEMPSSAKGDPDARARKRKQLKAKVAKTSEASKVAVEKVKKLKPKDKDEKKEGKHSATPAYVFAGLFALLYVFGRVWESRKARALFSSRLLD